MTEEMSTLQERMALAISKYEKEKGVKFKNTMLANFAKTTKQSVGYWVNGPTQKLDGVTLLRVAEFFGVDESWLAGKNVPMLNKATYMDNNVALKESVAIEGRLIPVIDWVQAGDWTGINTVPADTKFDEWLPYYKECGDRGYALVVRGLSMAPKFEPGDRIYVNPDIQTFDLKTNDLVIVSCDGGSEATFKKLIIEGDTKFLQALNPQWPNQIIPLSEDCRLVGKVVGMYRKV